MRNLIIFGVLLVIFNSCSDAKIESKVTVKKTSQKQSKYEVNANSQSPDGEYRDNHIGVESKYAINEKRIDGCEYIIVFGYSKAAITHKANCDNINHKN